MAVTAYTDYLALIDAGFTPPAGPGRCPQCAFHTPTQGHRQGCPTARKKKAALHPAPVEKARGPEVRKHRRATDHPS